MPLIITALAAFVLIVGFLLFHALTGRQEQPPVLPVETEHVAEHQITIHKTNAGILEFDNNWFVSDEDDATILKVPDNTLVSMKVTPKEGKYLNVVNIYEATSVTTAVSNKV